MQAALRPLVQVCLLARCVLAGLQQGLLKPSRLLAVQALLALQDEAHIAWLLAGGAAVMVMTCIMPFEVVQRRLQVRPSKTAVPEHNGSAA